MTPRKYYSNIIFTTSPITGHYRYSDLFQIYPIPFEDKLQFDKATHFPVIIEYWIDENEKKKVSNPMFDGIEEFISTSTLQNNWLYLLTRLLTVFTNHRFFLYDTERAWFFPLNTQITDATPSNWGFKCYHYEGLIKKINISSFSKIELPEITRVKHLTYFQYPNIDDHTVDVTLSEHTDLLFKAYQMLTIEERKYFDAAITLICNGQDLKYKMKSIAYLSFISSIETMSALQFKEKQDDIKFQCDSCKLIKSSPYTCPECNNPIWGISQQFKQYLSMYLSTDPKLNSVLNKIYGIRSKIVHSGQLLLGDAFIDWDKQDQQNKEFDTLLSLMQYSKLSICNWLILNAKDKAAANIGIATSGAGR